MGLGVRWDLLHIQIGGNLVVKGSIVQAMDRVQASWLSRLYSVLKFRIHRLSRIISTPAPSTNVKALGFSTYTVTWGMGNPSRAVLAMRVANASKVSKFEASTTWTDALATVLGTGEGKGLTSQIRFSNRRHVSNPPWL